MILVIPLILYSLLFLPFLGLLPFHDGVNQFLGTYSLFSGSYFTHLNYFHPPFPLIAGSIVLSVFGLYAFSFYGFIFGIAGIIGIFKIVEKIFDEKTALISALFLASSGLYISVGLFGLEDFIVTALILVAFACYVRKSYILFSIFASFAVLTKETAILFPISVLLIEIKNKKVVLTCIPPFLSLIGWVIFSNLMGHGVWNEWNFSETPTKGAFYTIAYNLLTFHFLNKYAYQNWLHLFILNFNYVFWIIAFVGIRLIRLTRPVAIIILFCALYILAVLSFQTYTITRYILPVLAFTYIFAAHTISKVKMPWSAILGTSAFIIVLVSLFTSVDPISNIIWSKTYAFGYPLYVGPFDGGDAITYNMEYMIISKKRNDVIKFNTCKLYAHEDLHLLPELLKDYHITNCLPK